MNDNEQLTLREIAQRAIDRNGGKGGRALGRLAEAQGLTLSYTTVDKLLAGTYTSRPSRKTLEALHTLSGIPREDVYEAAGQPLPQAPLAQQLPPEADLLTPDQRRVVVDVVRQFAKQNRALEEARRKRQEAGEHGGDTAANTDAVTVLEIPGRHGESIWIATTDPNPSLDVLRKAQELAVEVTQGGDQAPTSKEGNPKRGNAS